MQVVGGWRGDLNQSILSYFQTELNTVYPNRITFFIYWSNKLSELIFSLFPLHLEIYRKQGFVNQANWKQTFKNHLRKTSFILNIRCILAFELNNYRAYKKKSLMTVHRCAFRVNITKAPISLNFIITEMTKSKDYFLFKIQR